MWASPLVKGNSMRNRRLALAGLAAAAFIVAACGSSSAGCGGASSTPSSAASIESSPASSGTALKTAQISGATVLTNARDFTLYWFAPDTPAKSNCNGSCATFWPPVKGPATLGPGVTGKLRSEEHTSELQSHLNLVCRLLLEKKNK